MLRLTAAIIILAVPTLSQESPSAAPSSNDRVQLRAKKVQLAAEHDTLLRENESTEIQVSNLNKKAAAWSLAANLFGYDVPFGRIIPSIQILTGLPFIFAALCLIIILLRYPVASRKLLDLKYSLRLPVSRKGDTTPEIGALARLVWCILLVAALVLLALPAFSQETGANQSSVATLLRTGKEKLALDRLTQKQQDGSKNAYECFEAVLKQDPKNTEAKAGMQRIIDRLVTLSDEALSDQDKTLAKARLEEAARISGDQSAVNARMVKLALDNPTANDNNPENPDLSPEQDTSSKSLPSDIQRAIELTQLTPVQRLLRGLEQAKAGTSMSLTLTEEVLGDINDAAREHGHPPLITAELGAKVTLRVTKANVEYWILVAALREASDNDFAADLKEAVAAATAGTVDDSEGAVARCLQKLGDKDSLSRWITACVASASAVEDIENIVAVAREATLEAVAREAVNNAILRLSSDKQRVLPFVYLLYSLGAQKEAEALLLDYVQVAEYLELIDVLEWSVKNKNSTVAQSALKSATTRARGSEDVAWLIKTAAANGLMPQFCKDMSQNLANNFSLAAWRVPFVTPTEITMLGTNNEDVSLPTLVAVWLHKEGKTDGVRDLFEFPVSNAINHVIDTLGAEPTIPLNDVAALAWYYGALNDPGKSAADKMVAIQRALRGLDQSGGVSNEDAEIAALQLEVQTLTSRLAAEKKRAEELRKAKSQAQASLWKARVYTLLHGAAEFAKFVLVLLGFRIALIRAIAAAKQTVEFRFARFLWTFIETIGFELCCTVFFIVPGALLTLLAQDRLKHFRIGETLALCNDKSLP